MSERLPYEESLNQQLNDLPLPDQEQAWQKMNAMLEEEEDDRVVPPFFLRSCTGWALLILTMLALLWFIVRPEKWWQKEAARQPEYKTMQKKQEVKQSSKGTGAPYTVDRPGNSVSDHKIETDVVRSTQLSATPDSIHQHTSASPKRKVGKQYSATAPSIISATGQYKSKSAPVAVKKAKYQTSSKPGFKKIKKKADKESTGLENKNTQQPTQNNIKQPVLPVAVDSGQIKAKKDSADKILKAQPTNPAYVKGADSLPAIQPSVDKRSFSLSAGIGLQQQIPFRGQTATPYNYYGRKGSLADYIPSVYLRLQREKKWYLQTEFRFGGPQSVKELAYEQDIRPDSTGGPSVITTTLRLKKTFYHQLPISFNYFVRPNWSVGTGFLYSKFYSAVVEQEVKKRSGSNETVNKKIIDVRPTSDSLVAFTRSQINLVLQSEYAWKRFSVGVRYTKGLQPFIRYTDPAGIERQEKNQSFNVMVRYRIWKNE